ncbi:LysR family transcriptional regulator [Nonomuraea candida]|uniref:LysR family transcriptional regulator n=1 Tax=Nonomuraea candida TaxID=359159 RepID=UPI0005BAFD20|nr:LysR family transcriptional regulator [Nonomuraea candida]
MNGVELRHLRAFLAVADEGGFSYAADRLRVGQPVLSRTVRALEEAVGARLFDRTTRRVTLTPEGRRLHEELGILLPRLEQALRAPCADSLVRLGFTWLLPDGWPAVSQAFESLTGARVRLVRRDAPMAGLDRGDCDVAVLHGHHPHGRLLRNEARVAAVARGLPLARRRVLDWAELPDWPLVANTVTGTTTPDLWSQERAPSICCTADNFDEWVEAVAAGHGVGVAPESVRRYSHPDIRYIRLKNAPPVPLMIVAPPRDAHPLVARLVELATRTLAPSPLAS